MKMEGVSSARLLEMLSDRLGALEAVAYSSSKLSRYVSECEMSMDLLVAGAVLEFGEELSDAQDAASEWLDEYIRSASECSREASPTRFLELLPTGFGAVEAIHLHHHARPHLLVNDLQCSWWELLHQRMYRLPSSEQKIAYVF